MQTSTVHDNSADTNSIPFYHWTVVPDSDDADTEPDWMPSTDNEQLAVYCDLDGNGSIDNTEEVTSNYVWDFGTADQLPAITCTPDETTNQW